MKVIQYTLAKNNFQCYLVDSTFEVNLLTSSNKTTGIGSIICGRITTSMVLIDKFLRNQRLIENNSTLELKLKGQAGCLNLDVKINEFGEISIESDSLFKIHFENVYEGKLDVGLFMCGWNKLPLEIKLFEHQETKKINICEKYTNELFWTSNIGNISSEFSLILEKLNFKKTALSLGVEVNENDFSTKTSGGFLFVANTNNLEKLNSFSKHIQKLQPIKDLFFKNEYNEIKIEKEIFANFDFLRLDQKYYSYNFKAFNNNVYSKYKLYNAFKKMNIIPNYAQLVNVDYSNDPVLLQASVNKVSSKIFSHQNIKNGVIGVYDSRGYTKSILLDLQVNLTNKLHILNECDQDFYNSCSNILSLFANKLYFSVGFKNENLKLSGSSLSCSIYHQIYCLTNNININSNIIFSGNLDKNGNVKFVSSLIFKVKNAILHSYPVFVTSIENKLELESKLLNSEREQIKIIYIENIKEFLDELYKNYHKGE